MTPRHHRQMLLPGIGAEGQARLAASHAAIIGVGALGSASAELLARAGVGTLTLLDRDIVEPTNLQRQCLYAERDLDQPKAEAAARRLAEIDSALTLLPLAVDLAPTNAALTLRLGQPGGPTILLDGTDNFDTRYLLNDLAVKHRLPSIYGGVVATRGMFAAFTPGGPCLRCVFPEAPAPGSQPTCDTAGILGPAVATTAAGQASLALRTLLGLPVSPAITSFDLWSGDHRTLRTARDPACPCCGPSGRFDYLDARLGSRALWLCGQNSVQILPDRTPDDDEDTLHRLDLPALARRLEPHGPVTTTRFMTRITLSNERGDDGGPVHLSVFPDGRALIRGLRDPRRARALYDRYVGG